MQNIQEVPLICRKLVRNINPNTLGWSRPDGIINFLTNDAAKTYAINRCIAANKLKKKFERGIVVKDNMIISEVDGKLYSVNIDHKKLSQKYQDCDLYHNHTTPGTLSSADFSVLKSRNYIKSMTAIDIFGKYFTMTKMPVKNIKLLPCKISNFITITSQMIKGILQFEYIKGEYMYEIRKLEKELIKLRKELPIEELKQSPINKIFLEKVLKMVSELDKMWSKNAKSLGIKYEHGKF